MNTFKLILKVNWLVCKIINTKNYIPGKSEYSKQEKSLVIYGLYQYYFPNPSIPWDKINNETNVDKK